MHSTHPILRRLVLASALLAFFLLGNKLEYGYAYFAGLACATGLMAYQQYLIRRRDRDKCFNAFTNNIWVGFAIFCGTVAELSLRSILG